MTETAEKYTKQQIKEYCNHADDGEAVEIIKQLQVQVRATAHIAEALAKDLPDDKRITLNRFRVQELTPGTGG